ncbi:MAG: ABC transporter ATP-binding protein [Rhodovulum sulfidophilum]|uniref:ABC transporter ATP-binding protein n=1 Tax=Rhodovulum sulfidophilum TaxID=35806 RepID=A0A2W5Q9W0_RHOSU|nr:MAG: ABC transporter ATP-binding protein [Rhodovulum sulfidophilum]
MTTGLTIDRLNRSYGDVHVLRDIDLEIEPGGFTVLLGPSGCGKSTLLSAIAGLDAVDSGRILIGARDVTRAEPDQRGIAMVFQSYALYPTMTVRGNLSFGLRVQGMRAREVAARVAWAADLLRLTPLLDRKPSQLSGGQRQRVAIGRALVRRSDVCLFDEPLSNLDAKLRSEMRVEIKRLHGELGQTIVYVTHDQVEAMTMATRIAVMNRGVVEQYAEPETLYDRPETLFVAGFVGSPSMNFLPARLEPGEDGVPLLRLGDTVFALDAYAFRAPPRPMEVVLGVRPEHVAVASADAAEGLPVTFALRETLGADTLAWFDHGEGRVSARMDPAEARRLGAGAARLVLDLARVSLFDPETERRL